MQAHRGSGDALGVPGNVQDAGEPMTLDKPDVRCPNCKSVKFCKNGKDTTSTGIPPRHSSAGNAIVGLLASLVLSTGGTTRP